MKYLSSLSAAVIVILLIITTNSCSSNIESSNGVVVDKVVFITYKNDNGKNLLNPSTPHAYNPENITVYWLENGKKILAVDTTGNSDRKKLWSVDSASTGRCVLSILTPPLPDSKYLSDSAHGITTTLIKLSKEDTDTLKARLVVGENTILTKVWYNGRLKYNPPEGHLGGNIFITVTKPGSSQSGS